MIESLFMFYLIDLLSVIDIVSVVHIKTTFQLKFLVFQGNCSNIWQISPETSNLLHITQLMMLVFFNVLFTLIQQIPSLLALS